VQLKTFSSEGTQKLVQCWAKSDVKEQGPMLKNNALVSSALLFFNFSD
jgi:hypothetical protein